MSLAIFPSSAVPAGMRRTQNWNESDVTFDSGAYQAMTPFSRPLWKYEIPWQNINEIRQQMILTHVNSVKGRVFPWFFKDPYEFRIGSQEQLAGLSTGNTGYFTDDKGFFVYADATTVQTIACGAGFAALGVEFNYNQDSGIVTLLDKGVGSAWSTASGEYFRRVRYSKPYSDLGVLWQQFGVDIAFDEVAQAPIPIELD